MPHRSLGSHRLQVFGPFLAVGVLLVLLWSLVAWAVATQKDRLRGESERTLELIDGALAEQTQTLLRHAERDLRLLARWIEDHRGRLDGAAFAAFVDALQGGPRDLHDLRLAAADGTLHDAPSPRHGEGPVVLKRMPAPGEVLVGDPIAGARAGQSFLPLSLGLSRPRDGAAAVVALVDLEQLTALHERLRIKPAGSITLVRTTDGVLLSRTPPVPGLAGRSIGQSGWRVLQQPSGTAVYDGAITDHIRRLLAFRRLDGYPISVLASQGEDDAMAIYQDRRRAVLAICAAVSLLAIVLAAVLSRAQRQARLRQAELAAVSDESPVGMFRAAADGRITYANDAYLRIHGIAREELADGWLRLIHPDAREQAWSEWQRILRGTAPLSLERRVVRPDGTRALLAVHTAPVRVGGGVVGHVGTVIDITEEDRAEQALRTLTAIFDVTPDFVVQTDPQGRMTYMNPAARRVTGIALDQPVDGMTFAEFCPPETVEKNMREMVPAAREHGIWVGETIQWDARRRELPCSHILIAHRDRRGRLQHYSAIMRDISAEKAAEMRLVEKTRIDPLTGLLNRTGLEHALDALALSGGDGHVALMYVDLDRFKDVNDRHGHAAGDELLRMFAARLRDLLRPTDAVSRLGGDEFAVVLTGLREPANARLVADKILAAAHAPFRIGKADLRIGASIGITTWQAGHGDWRPFLERADAMLYRAKEAGRGRYADALNTSFH